MVIKLATSNLPTQYVLAWRPRDANIGLRSCLATNGATFRYYGAASHAAAAPEKGRSVLDGTPFKRTYRK